MGKPNLTVDASIPTQTGRNNSQCNLVVRAMITMAGTMVMFLNRQNTFYFRHCHDGQKPAEKQEQGAEQSKTSNQHSDVEYGWSEVTPR